MRQATAPPHRLRVLQPVRAGFRGSLLAALSDMTTATDVMQRDVITISPETPILDVYRMFVEEEIHGAPVVDEAGSVRGIVSTMDLLRLGNEEAYSARDSSGPLTAEDCATRELVSVSPETSVEEVARTMLAQRIHRVLVIDSKRELLGVISSFDLLRIVAGLDRR